MPSTSFSTNTGSPFKYAISPSSIEAHVYSLVASDKRLIAASTVYLVGDHIVMVTPDCSGSDASNRVDALCRLRAIVDQVSKTDDFVIPGLFKYGMQGIMVAMEAYLILTRSPVTR